MDRKKMDDTMSILKGRGFRTELLNYDFEVACVGKDKEGKRAARRTPGVGAKDYWQARTAKQVAAELSKGLAPE